MAPVAPVGNLMTRIAFLHPHRGAITPQNWSGTPAGITSALRARGVEVEEVGYVVPRLLRSAVHAWARLTSPDAGTAEHHPLKRALRRWSFQRQFDRLGAIDGVIAVGTDAYDLGRLRIAAPVATYDDATLATMWAHADSDTRGAGFRDRDVDRWIETQRVSTLAADVVCVSTAWAARSFEHDYRVPADRIAVVGMGHRPKIDGVAPERDWSTPIFLFVGIDWVRKNGDAVLRAFRRVREQHPGAILPLVGEHPNVDEPGVVDHGLLARADPAAQQLLARLFADATAFVMPSRFDPSPIAYLEAASAGVPVVATTQGGAGELLGSAAVTVDPTDDDAIAAAMELLADPAEARRRGAAAAEAAARSRWDDVAGRILAALDRAR
jgi:glycosyltransferase involved in cell wall biosynthesis